jgi:serine/threonine protein kinase
MSEAEQSKDTTGPTESKGRLLAGRYRMGAVLGRGGMGTVWRAVDETLGRTVAVKELRFPSSIDEDEKRRLITRTLREAKAIARIRSNGAVTVFDVVDEDDRPWIVMELIEGRSLADAIREDGPLTPRRAAEVGLAVLDVLRAAHREGILHRDVKPSNVLISDGGTPPAEVPWPAAGGTPGGGRVVLTDFGIAQVEGDPSITSTGMLVGAPSYISPERARGHKPGPAADLWSLGALLYACVEGVPPYDKGSAIATLTAVMTEPLAPPKNAGELEEAIYGLLHKDPERRLDEAGARALLTHVSNAPERPEPEPADATRVVALPEAPDAPAKGVSAERKVSGSAPAAASASALAPDPAGGGSSRPTAVAQRAPLTDAVSRRTLMVVALVAALAVLGTVLAFVLNGGDDDSQGGEPGSGSVKSPSAGATADSGKDDRASDSSTDAEQSAGGGSGSAPSAPPSASDTAEGAEESGGSGNSGSSDAVVPKGYAEISDSTFHFTMALPKGWKRTGIAGQNSGGIYSKSGGFPRLQVDFTSSPGDDAAKAWRELEPTVARNSNGYKLLGIQNVDYRDYPTVADWQFERQQNGKRVRVLNRGFKVDGSHAYSIMITCVASEWGGKECKTLRRTAFRTFQPKG